MANSNCPEWCVCTHHPEDDRGCVGEIRQLPGLPRDFAVSLAPVLSGDGVPLVFLEIDVDWGDMIRRWLTPEQSAQLRAALDKAERQALLSRRR